MWADVAIPSGMEMLLSYAVPPEAGDVEVGQLVRVPVGSRKGVAGLVWAVSAEKPEIDPGKIQFLERPEGWPSLGPGWVAFLAWMADYYLASPCRLAGAALPSWVLEMLAKGTLEKRSAAVLRRMEMEIPPADPPPLNADQEAAVRAVLAAGKGYAPFLLQGVTGSGKTRVYAELVRRTLDEGRNCLVLVPEISLTRQTRDAFVRLVGERVELFHSGLPDGVRKEIWRRALSGECRVLMGTRSASLLPMRKLGLVVVDEEHDSSYKQEDLTPFYNARDAMLWRARQLKIPIVLGSATPSLESRELADAGKLTLLRLDRRASGRPLPSVEIVDMRGSLRDYGAPLLSPRLREAVQKTRDEGGQAILLHNRRGFAPAWTCVSCGETARCPDCDVALVYHRAGKVLKCHQCERLLSLKTPCARCGGTEFVPVGFGIEQLEEELLKWIPGLRVLRLDRDTTAKAGEMERILEAFRNGEADVLLGTQMVAKGHDFPRVRLVGVAAADATLTVPDFRAGERMFQLVAQVAGRAGRGDEPGEVIVQTHLPDDPVMRFALNHDYEGARALLREDRARFGYPPFARAATIELSGPRRDETLDLAARAAELAREGIRRRRWEGIEVLGPAEAPVFRVRNRYRYRLLVKGRESSRVRTAVQIVKKELKLPKTIQLRANVDPQSMM